MTEKEQQRQVFLATLAANEDDEDTRLIFADWLEEHGEDEEATRQRALPAAKQWLVELCEEYNPGPREDEETEEYYEQYNMTYGELLARARAALADYKEHGSLVLSCGDNMGMMDALEEHKHEFWANWSIVTGTVLPEGAVENSWFRCAC